MAQLTVQNLSFTYAGEEKEALHDVSFSLEKGAFAVLCGATGSGKSTLMRLIKRELAPMGKRTGKIAFDGICQEALDKKTAACEIGYVMQQPEDQLVTDKVYHELAFGLENMGVPGEDIRRRVAEMASYFGIEDWFLMDVSSLSGGQKQLLNLASVMVMGPKLLLLDEPTAQLDPIAAADFITVLQKLNREFGLTMLMIEHKLDEILPVCDTLLVMEKGKITACDSPKKVIAEREGGLSLLSLPTPTRVYLAMGKTGDVPVSVREGRDFLLHTYKTDIKKLEKPPYTHEKEAALRMHHVYFRYDKKSPDVLSDLDFTVYQHEIFCIVGGNGSGKTTTLATVAGLHTPYSGSVEIFGKKRGDYKNGSLYQNCLALLPQDIKTLFLKNTVAEEFKEVKADYENFPYDFTDLLHRHPYDLSGGERQLVGLCKVLSAKPKLLLLDEPTKGLDAFAKAEIVKVLKALQKEGVTVILVTHDVEFAATVADRVALFFRGNMICTDTPGNFFAENNFYTTTAARMTRDIFENTVSAEDVVTLLERNGEKA